MWKSDLYVYVVNFNIEISLVHFLTKYLLFQPLCRAPDPDDPVCRYIDYIDESIKNNNLNSPLKIQNIHSALWSNKLTMRQERLHQSWHAIHLNDNMCSAGDIGISLMCFMNILTQFFNWLQVTLENH